MGDPGRLRKKFSKPSHPWQKTRIEEEKVLMSDYGLKNKAELWKLNSVLRTFKSRIKELIPKQEEQAQKEKQLLLAKLQKLNLIKESSIPEDILAITLKDVCERRLQTIVLKKRLARSVNQARQMIVHEHVLVGEKKITSPSYLVGTEEESLIKIAPNSSFSSEDHPERRPVQKEIKQEKQKAGLGKDVEIETPISAQEEMEQEVKQEEAEMEEEIEDEQE